MITDIDKQTALILIDLQNAIVNAQLAHPVAEILQNANKLCDVFHDKKLPVIIVNVNPQSAPWTKSRKDSKPSPIPQDDEWFQITDKLHVHPSDIRITKKHGMHFLELHYMSN